MGPITQTHGTMTKSRWTVVQEEGEGKPHKKKKHWVGVVVQR